MIRNGIKLVKAQPLKPLLMGKKKEHGVSHGLSEAGYDIRIAQTVVLHPLRRFRLASAFEYFDMPEDLVGVVHDKSTWARQGLSVFNTVIEPGWHGFLTLELVYHGWGVLRVPKGAGIAQVLFHQLEEVGKYEGKYQGQGNGPVKAIMESGDE